MVEHVTTILVMLVVSLTFGCSYDWEVVALDSSSEGIDDTESETEEPPDASHPCFNVVCDTPWETTCDGGSELTIYGPQAWCRLADTDSTAGVCEYERRTLLCPSGVCITRSGAAYCEDHPCLGLDCHHPRAAECADPNSLNVSHRLGRCALGDTDSTPGCVYSTTPVDCPVGGCAQSDTDSVGAAAPDGCADDPCLHRLCNSPPPSYCADGKLVLFEAIGRCGDDGQCVYKSRSIDCATGSCSNGRCEEDPCSHVTCRRPPAHFCEPGDQTLRTYHPSGWCVVEQGRPVCRYEEVDIACPDTAGCDDGRCINGAPMDTDECIGVAEHCVFIDSDSAPPTFVPLPPHCRDASTIVRWNYSNGSCVDGVCLFGYAEDSGTPCADGVVVGSECTLALCVAAPAPYCNGDTLVTYPLAGRCVGDVWCDYAPQLTTCDNGCDPLTDPFMGTCSP